MKKMEQATAIKAVFTAIFAFISALLGDLAVPVLLMVACSVIDYITGLGASPYRKKDGENGSISSYKSIRGIIKKVCMWLLVVVGAIIDQLLIYTTDKIGITMPFEFLVACIVAVWIICNELISILENIKDMGVKIPAFLTPIIKNIQSQTESKAGSADKVVNKDNDSGGE